MINVESIRNLSLRSWITILIIVFFLFLALWLFSSFALVRITYSVGEGVERDDLSAVLHTTDDEAEEFTNEDGLTILPRSASSITASSGRAETRVSLSSLPLFQIKDIEIKLEQQLRVDKIGAQGLDCDLVNGQGAFSYRCANPSTIEEFTRPSDGRWVNTVEFDTDDDFSRSARYREGFLIPEGFVADESSGVLLKYLVPGKGSPYEYEEEVRFEPPSEPERELQVINNRTDSDDEQFVLTDRTAGTFYYFSSIKSEHDHSFSRQTDINPVFDAGLCRMNAQVVVCYYGSSSIPPDSQEETAYREENPGGFFEVYTLDGSSEVEVYESSFGADGVNELFITKDQGVFAVSDNRLYAVDFSGDRSDHHFITEDFSGVSAGENLFYTQDEGLFEYITADEASYLRFSSDNLILSNMSIYGESVLFNSFVAGGQTARNTSHAFALTDEFATEEVRKVDILPYNDPELPILFMDYDSDRIFVHLRVMVTSNHQTGEMEIDEQEKAQAARTVTERLEQDGLLEDDPELIFETY